jgi:hypothetical protein
MIKTINTQSGEGRIYLGHGCLDMGYKLNEDGTITLACEGREVDSNGTSTSSASFDVVGNPDATVWGEWVQDEHQESVSRRQSITKATLSEGKSLVISTSCQNQIDAHFKVSFKGGILEVSEIATYWYGGGEELRAWLISGIEVPQGIYEGFIKAIEKEVSDEQ